MEIESTEYATVKATIAARKWSASSWRSCESLQMASYEDNQAAYETVISKLSKVPPLVHASEVDKLREALAAAARGEKFILQGGDCAERFMDCEQERIEKQMKVLVQMGALIEQTSSKPVIRIARIAGQYGKPRSKPKETVPDVGEVFSFKGDNINGYEIKDRAWDPARLLLGYWHSSATLNCMRTLMMSPDYGEAMLGGLDVAYLKSSPSFGAWSKAAATAKAGAATLAPELYTAHEAMQLDLEEALTREVRGKGFYNLSAHTVWIGDRTRQLLGGHVEYFRGIQNPIGCKVGPSMKPDELKELVQILNPDKVEGRLILITRYGHAAIESMLPAHIKAVQASGVPVVWQCDGVHGNTVTASNKLKTRKFEDVMGECKKALKIHSENGSILAGIHIELTGGETVTECTGGIVNVLEEMLPQNYETYCDPRLNYGQSIEAALVVGSALGGK